jgi:hypothetical protein
MEEQTKEQLEHQKKLEADFIRRMFLNGAEKFRNKLKEHNESKKDKKHCKMFTINGFHVMSNTQANARKKVRSLAGNILMAPNLTSEELEETVRNISAKLFNI